MAADYANGVPCPKCGGRMYDNRLTKKSPKQSDFRCCQDNGDCKEQARNGQWYATSMYVRDLPDGHPLKTGGDGQQAPSGQAGPSPSASAPAPSSAGRYASDPKKNRSIEKQKLVTDYVQFHATTGKKTIPEPAKVAEWVNGVHALVHEPDEGRTSPSASPSAEATSNGITSPQLKMIKALARELIQTETFDEDTMQTLARNHMEKNFGASSTKDLDKGQASDMIEYLQGLKEAATKATPEPEAPASDETVPF